MRSADDIERNAFQQWIAELTTAAEKWAKVPYDVVSPKLGLTPNVHRLPSLGHNPLLGLVLGVGDILSGTCTFWAHTTECEPARPTPSPPNPASRIS